MRLLRGVEWSNHQVGKQDVQVWEEMIGWEGSHGDRGCNQPAWRYLRENSTGEKI